MHTTSNHIFIGVNFYGYVHFDTETKSDSYIVPCVWYIKYGNTHSKTYIHCTVIKCDISTILFAVSAVLHHIWTCIYHLKCVAKERDRK